jgi:hypothetical protein
MQPLEKPGEEVVTLVTNWQRAGDALDAERLRELRSLSERESAQRFARLFRLDTPYPLRLTSGLVEQQRLLGRLRNIT